MGSIADNDLGGIYAQMKCNRDESGCLLEEFPDLEKPIENLEAENQRLKKQLKDYEKTLKEYAESDNWDLNTLDIENLKYGWRPALVTLKKWEME